MPVAAWKDWWLRATARQWPAWVDEAAGTLPVVKAPEDITLLVAGADLAIPQLAYFPSWGFPPCRVTRAITPPIIW